MSANVAADRSLTFGNEFLTGVDENYAYWQRKNTPGYRAAAILDAFATVGVGGPPGGAPGVGAQGHFVSYLLLDTLVGNTDRHQENWGILDDPAGERPPQLAPSFDHASSLGFQLTDDERQARLDTTDVGYTVGAYAARARSRHFEGAPLLLDLAVDALGLLADAERAGVTAPFETVAPGTWADLLGRVPATSMSQPSRMFVTTMLDVNSRRLLDALARVR